MVARIVMVVSGWRWVVGGDTVLLGNAIAGGQTHCNGGFQVAVGCRWSRCVIRDFNRTVKRK